MSGQTAGGDAEETLLTLITLITLLSWLHIFWPVPHMDVLLLNRTDFVLPLAEYSFERRFDERGAIEWMQANWWANKLCVCVCVCQSEFWFKSHQPVGMRIPNSVKISSTLENAVLLLKVPAVWNLYEYSFGISEIQPLFRLDPFHVSVTLTGLLDTKLLLSERSEAWGAAEDREMSHSLI